MMKFQQIPAIVLGLMLSCWACGVQTLDSDTGSAADAVSADTPGSNPSSWADLSGEPMLLTQELFFQDPALPIFRLELPAESWFDYLWPQVHCPVVCGDEREYRPGTLYFFNPWSGREEIYYDVGVRFRGNSSACGDNARIGMKISFNEYVRGRKFHGMKKINLMGTEGDNAMMREYLAAFLLHSFGVATPSITYARVSINGEPMRLYPIIQESDDKPFLEYSFPEEEEPGNLYKIEGYCGWAPLEYWGDDPDPYVPTYDPRAGTEMAGMTEDIIPMLKCFELEDDQEFKSCFESYADVDLFLRAMVADLSMPDYDSSMNAGQNFSIYFRSTDKKAVLIPWDKDAVFRSTYCDETEIFNCSPPWSERPPGMVRLMELYRPRILELTREFLEGPMSPEVLDVQIDQLYAMMAPYLDLDPDVKSFHMGWYWESAVDELREGVRTRRDALRGYLDSN